MSLVALFLFVVWIQTKGSPDTPIRPEGCATILCCKNCDSLRVTSIIDGDTFNSTAGKVRLFGIDTPEKGEPCFFKAKSRLTELAGSTVRVEKGPRSQDLYGRLLFYIYTKQGESIDEIMVTEGLAHAWTLDGQHANILKMAAADALNNSTGCLW
ncbi:uncharacterized protein METZ01_LOCUS244641 [marine metagenome]|uniref:TNase-like domain-containing protein n=1 Tax=marine metagenome TaxID=408172 RepID=A0A382HXU9_9ZZZZ